MSDAGSLGRRAFVLLAVAVTAASLLRLAGVALVQLAWPFDIGNETAQLCSIRVLQRGLPLYAPSTYADDPFVLTMYTPLYHALVAWLPAAAGRPFMTGRLVSMAAMLVAAAAVLAVGSRRGRLAPALLAFGGFFLLWPALVHTAYLRNDGLALALSAWAVVLVDRRGSEALVLAAVLSALAVATKQSYVAAALGCGIYLLLTDRRAAWLYLAVLVASLAAGAWAATRAWGHGFWFSTLVAPSAGAFSGLPEAVLEAARQPIFLLLVALSLWADVTVLRGEGLAALRRSPYALYAIATLVVLGVTVGKAGANELCLLEFAFAHLLWLVSLSGRDAPVFGRAAGVVASLAIALVAALELTTPTAKWTTLAYGAGPSEQRAAYYDAARAGLAARGVVGGRVLDLGLPCDALGVADDVALNDAFLYRLLWQRGLLDPQALVDAVRRRAFDLVMLPAALPMPPPAAPGASDAPLLAVARAVAERYEPAGRDAAYAWFIRPRE